MSSLYTRRALIVVTAADRNAANQDALTYDPAGGAETFRAALSVSGTAPATHYWCSAALTEPVWQAIQTLEAAQVRAHPLAVRRHDNDACTGIGRARATARRGGRLMVTRRAACAGLGAAALAVSWDRQPSPVQGDAVFAGTVREALALLANHWGWLVDTLDVIRLAEPSELPGDSLAGLLVRDTGYVAILNPGLQGVAYTASLLAHEAWHACQHSQGRRYYGRGAEQEAWALQAVVMADLLPGNLAVPWLLGSIAGLPDGGPLPGNPEV